MYVDILWWRYSVEELGRSPGGGALGYFLSVYVPPVTPNWHPVLKNIFP